MSNSWFYTLLIKKQKFLGDERFTSVVEASEALGFTVKNPVTGLISYITKDGTEWADFDNLEDTGKVISQSGGTLQLWKHDVDIGLTFDHSGEGQAATIHGLGLDDKPHLGSISLLIDDTHFKDRVAGESLANDIKRLFVELCVNLGAVYGYSIDENLFEWLMHRWHIHQDVKSQKKPSVLCWLNYFEGHYISKIGMEKLRNFDCKITEIPSTGVIVSFFESPREVRIPVMQKINEKWWKESAG